MNFCGFVNGLPYCPVGYIGTGLFGDGSAAAPSVAGFNYQSTGLFWSANKLGISVSGNEVASLTSNGGLTFTAFGAAANITLTPGGTGVISHTAKSTTTALAAGPNFTGTSSGNGNPDIFKATGGATSTETGFNADSSAGTGGQSWSIWATSSSSGVASNGSLAIYNRSTSKIWFQISALGNQVPGNAALATNATDGFVYLPTCAGAPTGVPTAYTGRVAHIYDTTNNKLYVYNGAWKSSAAFT